MIEISNIFSIWVLIFALFLFMVSIYAYHRHPHKRLLLVCMAFALFFVKGIVLCFGILYNNIKNLNSAGLEGFFDIIILTFLIAAIVKK